jgi:hypothetical protein
MTLEKTASMSFTDTLDDLTNGQRYTDLVKMIGSVVDYGLSGVKGDVERWLSWILASGTRPQPTKRSLFANGVDAYATTQDAICAVLSRLANVLDWNNPRHFWLIERATRPLSQTARHPKDVEFWNPKSQSHTAS